MKYIISLFIFCGMLFSLVPNANAQEITYEDLQNYILKIMNDSRFEHNLEPYSLNENWSGIAVGHSLDIAEHTKGNILLPTDDKISHDSTDGRTTGDRIRNTQFTWSSFGENVAWSGQIGHLDSVYDLINTTHNQMMDEPDGNPNNHRGHILHEKFNIVGIGLVYFENADDEEIYYTVDFIEDPFFGMVEASSSSISSENISSSVEILSLSSVSSEMVSSPSVSVVDEISDNLVIGQKKEVNTYFLERLFVDLINEERDKRGLSLLAWSEKLQKTAENWNSKMIEKKITTHLRLDGSTMHEWIKQFNLPFASDYQNNYFTENIFRLVFGCLEECSFTPESELRSRFKEFMAEESANGAHFRSIVHSDFTDIGVAVQKKSDNEYYGTIHYGRLEKTDDGRLFLDIDVDHKSFDAVKYLKNKNILKGYEDGFFRPGNAVTRAELLKIVMKTFDIQVDENKKALFKDVGIKKWYSPYIAEAVEKGIVKGYDDGYFRPDKTVSRIEAIKIICNAYDANLLDVTGEIFLDVKKGDWFAPYVKYVVYNKFIDHPGKRFRINDGMTREDVSEFVYRILR